MKLMKDKSIYWKIFRVYLTFRLKLILDILINMRILIKNNFSVSETPFNKNINNNNNNKT